MIKPGYYRARALEAKLGKANTGTEQVGVTFQITEEGEANGQTITWYGYFTEATTQRTLESLEHCGWDGESLEKLTGLGRTEVTLVLGEEEYQGRTSVKVQWVNRLGGGVAMKNVMSEGEVKSFNERMKAELLKRKQERKNQGGDPAGFDYGANEKKDGPPV